MPLNGFHFPETAYEAHRVRCQNSSSMLKVLSMKQTQRMRENLIKLTFLMMLGLERVMMMWILLFIYMHIKQGEIVEG